ncbi:protein of unknown function [Pseudomonas sp. JV241A]|nr:protein of unknown function [Pseudomonas sp. JV241A]
MIPWRNANACGRQHRLQYLNLAQACTARG